MSCPAINPGVLPGSTIHSLAIAVSVLFPLYVIACWTFFYVNRPYHVFLRKRSLGLMTLSCVGTVFFWASTVLYDSIGADKFPCILYVFLVYVSTPAVGGPVLIQGHLYYNEVSYRILAQNGPDIRGKLSWETFTAHLEAVFCFSRKKEIRLKNAQFSRTYFFWLLWTVITVSPYGIAFLVRLGTEPGRQSCTGCYLQEADLITLTVINIINWGLAQVIWSLTPKRDFLRITRQCLFGIAMPMPGIIFPYILAIVDPNETYAHGGLNFMSLSLLAPGLCIYVITVNQVFVARLVKRKVLFSNDVDRLDRFEDVMADKELKAKLINYMHFELSSEIIMFLGACELVKSKFASNKPEGEAEARLVFRQFIEKNKALNEINLPSDIRERITQKMKGELDSTVFDEAYIDVRNNLLKDGFPRFLNRLKKEETTRQPRKTIRALATRVETHKSQNSEEA